MRLELKKGSGKLVFVEWKSSLGKLLCYFVWNNSNNFFEPPRPNKIPSSKIKWWGTLCQVQGHTCASCVTPSFSPPTSITCWFSSINAFLAQDAQHWILCPGNHWIFQNVRSGEGKDRQEIQRVQGTDRKAEKWWWKKLHNFGLESTICFRRCECIGENANVEGHHGRTEFEWKGKFNFWNLGRTKFWIIAWQLLLRTSWTWWRRNLEIRHGRRWKRC